MAGHDDCNGISATGSSNGTGRSRPSNSLRQLTIRTGFTIGNTKHCLPDGRLKWRAVQIQRTGKLYVLPREIASQLVHCLLQRRNLFSFDHILEWEPAAEPGETLVRFRSWRSRPTNTCFRRHDNAYSPWARCTAPIERFGPLYCCNRHSGSFIVHTFLPVPT